ncbi:MAG: winged helix-turn-helix domain-containing protein [Candidatus Bathyarchaeia archaeon]
MQDLRKLLTAYSILDNDYRLNILFTVADEPELSFNDIARKTGIEKALLAYHIGVLKHVGLVEMEYQKRSRKLTKYKLTEEGKKILEKLKQMEKAAEIS